MSIIDQIGEIEEQLQQIRKNGDKEVVRIKQETDEKKHQMQEAFFQELAEEKEKLQQEMLNRVEIYKNTINSGSINIKEKLEQRYRVTKDQILQQICQDFWRV